MSAGMLAIEQRPMPLGRHPRRHVTTSGLALASARENMRARLIDTTPLALPPAGAVGQESISPR